MSNNNLDVSAKDVLRFVNQAEPPIRKKDIAKYFRIRGKDKQALDHLLSDLNSQNKISMDGDLVEIAGENQQKNQLIEIIDITVDGDVFAHPVKNDGQLDTHEKIEVTDLGRHSGKVKQGIRALADVSRADDDTVYAKLKKIMASDRVSPIIGIFNPGGRKGMAGSLQTIDRRERDDYQVPKGQTNGAKKGDIVEAEEISGNKGSKKAKIRKIFGHRDDTDAISLIAIHEFGVPMDFSDAALNQAKQAEEPRLEDFRTDLRHIPFVTIDGADARDFDDAVYARADDHPTNPDGYYVIVAIADVAKYVEPDSPLDQDAYERGNSVYLPDRVVPMLPEELSNGLCSLRPDEDRATLAMHMRISKDGELRDFKCQRAMIRSVARLTYDQVHHAREGNPDNQTAPIYDTLIAPLYDVFETLKSARIERGALEIDRPERKIHIDDTGNLERVSVSERFDSHRVIEELMIQANVAAGRLLSESETPALYRIHDKPDLEKITAVRPLLHDLGYPLTTGEDIHPRDLNAVLMQAKQKDEQPLISELVLRCQSNATYSPDNIGHFGLGLDTYAHFTSPIRRYADLVVHRALIDAMGLGTGGHIRDDLHDVGEHISTTERRATLAERNTVDRFTARYLTDHIGEEYKGRITGVTSFGLFVMLEDVGADGILPMRNMKGDYFEHKEDKHALVGKRTGAVFRLAAPVRVIVVEADGITGSLVLKMAKGIKDADFPVMAKAS